MRVVHSAETISLHTSVSNFTQPQPQPQLRPKLRLRTLQVQVQIRVGVQHSTAQYTCTVLCIIHNAIQHDSIQFNSIPQFNSTFQFNSVQYKHKVLYPYETLNEANANKMGWGTLFITTLCGAEHTINLLGQTGICFTIDLIWTLEESNSEK